MAKAPWKTSLIASVAAVAIAATGVGMALTADKAASVPSTAFEDRVSVDAMWTVAEAFVSTPVRFAALKESAPSNGHWQDYLAVSAVVEGKPGELVIGRDFGPSEEADIADLMAIARPAIESVTVGFKASGESEQWLWARYDAEGTLLRNAVGQPVTSRFAAVADPQCIAQAWTGVIQSG